MIILAFAENAIQLVPDGTLLIHLLMVVIMVFVLNRTLFRPINRVLAEREARTSGKLDEAKNLRVEFENGLARYERGLREARISAYHLVEKQRIEALGTREEQVTQVREEIRTWVAQEKVGIEHQAEEARRALALESIQSASQIGSQILHRPVNNTGI